MSSVRTEIGEVWLEVPRDQSGTFEAALVPKHARRLAGFNEAVISLYAKGLITGDIDDRDHHGWPSKISARLVAQVHCGSLYAAILQLEPPPYP